MAPITHLTKDDPPVLMQYSFSNTPIHDANADLNLVVHHPLFGIALQEKMTALGIECLVQYHDPTSGSTIPHGGKGEPEREVDFIRRHFAQTAW